MDKGPAIGTRQWAIEQSGCPGRQLDRWAEKGYLRPARARPDRRRAHRVWSEHEAHVAQLMVRLTAGGLTVTAAAKVARHTVAQADNLAPYAVGEPDLWCSTDLTDDIRVEVKIA